MIKYYLGILILSLMVIGAVVYGFNSSGSPASIRAAKFDTQRITDMNTYKYSIESYYTKNGRLPGTLEEAQTNYYGYSRSAPTDPETKKPYEYIPGIDNSYKLCAIFSASNLNDSGQNRNVYYTSYGNEFKHPKGYYCFDLTTYKSQAYPTAVPQYYYTTPTPTPY